MMNLNIIIWFFFGGKMTQNMNLDRDDGKLERFTGR